MPTQTLLHGPIDDKIKNRDLNPNTAAPLRGASAYSSTLSSIWSSSCSNSSSIFDWAINCSDLR